MNGSSLGKLVHGLSIIFLEDSNSLRTEEFIHFSRNINRTFIFLK